MKFLVILPLFISVVTAQIYTVYPPQTTKPSSLTNSDTTITITRTSNTRSEPTISTSSETVTALSECHYHGVTQFCLANGLEGQVIGAPTKTAGAATTYTDCHSHSSETFCVSPAGEEYQFSVYGASNTEAEEEEGEEGEEGGKKCHFHAGVEHCVGGSKSKESATCSKIERDYNIPLRIGLIFVILFTSAISAFGPIVLDKIFGSSRLFGMIFTILKQFGTGVIISTAFVHLITHANLMWANECMGELSYEATGSALTIAGIFLAFLVEYAAYRLLISKNTKLASVQKTTSTDEEEANEANEANEADKEKITSTETANSLDTGHGHTHSHGLLKPAETLSVFTMEAGIIFHSVLIGITLVVAGDSSFITLFIVILFHQAFEGVALGSRITSLKNCTLFKKFVMAFAFSITTPIGMAIGTGVLSKFNGNDKSTLIALGTLDSFSAGILIWTGIVEMWCNDWLFGDLAQSGLIHTLVGLVSLMTGIILMSVLGKWA